MDGTICYLNTDLDLTSLNDLTPLAAAFKAQGSWINMDSVRQEDDGHWHASFETAECMEEPEHTIREMLDMIESLDEPAMAVWSQCAQREFNIGYDCGSRPWAFNQGLSHELLARIAAVGATLRITLYPSICEKNADQNIVPDNKGT